MTKADWAPVGWCAPPSLTMANEPLPLDGVTELYDVADIHEMRLVRLTTASAVVSELPGTLPSDVLSEPADIDEAIELVGWLVSGSLLDTGLVRA